MFGYSLRPPFASLRSAPPPEGEAFVQGGREAAGFEFVAKGDTILIHSSLLLITSFFLLPSHTKRPFCTQSESEAVPPALPLSHQQNRSQGKISGGGAVKTRGRASAGWAKDSIWDQRAMGQPSSMRLYFLSPTRGRPREENWQRI